MPSASTEVAKRRTTATGEANARVREVPSPRLDHVVNRNGNRRWRGGVQPRAALSGLGAKSGLGALLPGLIAAGFGIGLTTAPVTTASLDFAPAKEAGLRAGILNTSRRSGLAIGDRLDGRDRDCALAGWTGRRRNRPARRRVVGCLPRQRRDRRGRSERVPKQAETCGALHDASRLRGLTRSGYADRCRCQPVSRTRRLAHPQRQEVRRTMPPSLRRQT